MREDIGFLLDYIIKAYMGDDIDFNKVIKIAEYYGFRYVDDGYFEDTEETKDMSNFDRTSDF